MEKKTQKQKCKVCGTPLVSVGQITQCNNEDCPGEKYRFTDAQGVERTIYKPVIFSNRRAKGNKEKNDV